MENKLDLFQFDILLSNFFFPFISTGAAQGKHQVGKSNEPSPTNNDTQNRSSKTPIRMDSHSSSNESVHVCMVPPGCAQLSSDPSDSDKTQEEIRESSHKRTCSTQGTHGSRNSAYEEPLQHDELKSNSNGPSSNDVQVNTESGQPLLGNCMVSNVKFCGTFHLRVHVWLLLEDD